MKFFCFVLNAFAGFSKDVEIFSEFSYDFENTVFEEKFAATTVKLIGQSPWNLLTARNKVI